MGYNWLAEQKPDLRLGRKRLDHRLDEMPCTDPVPNAMALALASYFASPTALARLQLALTRSADRL